MKDRNRIRHYNKTVDISPHGAAKLIRTGLPLFSGDTGRMAHFSPRDMRMHIRFLNQSLPNQKHIFTEILAGRPNIYYDDREGVHTGGAERATIEHLALRMSGVIWQLSSKVKPEDIDYDFVHQTAIHA